MTDLSNQRFSPQEPLAATPQATLGPLRFILYALATAALMLLLNLLLMAATVGRPTAASQAFCERVQSRVALARASAQPNLLLIGGSAVRAGFSAEQLSQALHLHAVNFGLQAALGPDLILDQAKKALKSGDTALLAFEYPQYRHAQWNPIELNVGMGCAAEWFRSKSWPERVEAWMATSFSRPWKVLSFALQPQPGGSVHDANAYGDRLPQSFPKLPPKVKQRMALYRPVNIGIDLDSRGVQAIRDFVAYARAHHIRVYATWPNTIDFPEYAQAPGFKQIQDFYTGLGVEMIGDPQLGLYPLADFYDTQYHLRYEAIRQRTQDFIAQVKAQHVPLMGSL